MSLAEAHLVPEGIVDALVGTPLAHGFARWEKRAPAPWQAWLLVCLARQLVRQQWVVRVLEERLPGVRRGSGEVPGMPGVRFSFHGKGCMLSTEGEEIDVDFYGDGGCTIDPYFFAGRALHLATPPLPEARLRALLPEEDLISRAIRDLYPTGLLIPGESDHVFRLCRALESLAERLAEVDFADPAKRELFCVHLGDFEAASSADSARAASARAAYLTYLYGLLAANKGAHVALEPLARLLSPQDFIGACAQVIRGPIGYSTGAAVERLNERPELPFCPAALELWDRLSPDEHHPYSACAAADYLLTRGVAKERVIPKLLAFGQVEVVRGYLGNPMLDEIALITLAHAPEHALALVRRALRSSTPIVRQKMAAALAALAAPWCRRELARALEEMPALEEEMAEGWYGEDELQAHVARLRGRIPDELT